MTSPVLRKIFGLLAVLIGLVGTGLGVFVILNIAPTADSIKYSADETLGQLEVLVESVHEQSDSAVSIVAAAGERVGAIEQSIGTLAGADDSDDGATNLLNVLDEGVVRRLEAAEEFIRSMQGTLRNAGSALLLLDSMPFFSTRLSSSVDQRENQLHTLASSLNEISDLLEQAIRTLTEIRANNRIDPKQVEQLQAALLTVQERLKELETDAQEFTTRVGEVRDNVDFLRRSTPDKVDRAATLTAVFFVCFAVAQISLLLHGAGQFQRPQPT